MQIKYIYCDNLLVVGEFFSDGGEVHGLLDDLPVSWDRFMVDWFEEGPSMWMGLKLRQQLSVEKMENKAQHFTPQIQDLSRSCSEIQRFKFHLCQFNMILYTNNLYSLPAHL